MKRWIIVLLAFAAAAPASAVHAQTQEGHPHNVVLFVADGLRSRMVDELTAPTMAAMAREGVYLRNGHALFPTFTTANASAMATGHMLGDTGDFSNTIYAGFAVPGAGGSSTPFLENDQVLADVDDHFAGNYLDEATILKLARETGFSTAAVGKLGPTLIFDHTRDGRGQTIIVDDATGSEKGVPLSAEMTERLKSANLPASTPPRGANGKYGDMNTSGTLTPNIVQQDYFAAVTAKVILPLFKERGKPFVLVFWSRDPDGTQHYQGDSFNSLIPGINGPTSLAAIRNADDDLARIRAALGELGLLDTTDIVAIADHGFSTIAKQSRTSSTVKEKFADTPEDRLPLGFVALDLAHALDLPLIDPDNRYKPVTDGQHSKFGNGLIGGDKNNPKIVVTANGGSDVIYLPDADPAIAKRVVEALLAQDYVSGIFVDARLGKFPGTLTLDDIALDGSSITPHPAIVCRSSVPLTPCAGSRCAARSRSPTPFCRKARACTARSAAPTPGISWRCRGRISKRASSIRRRPATPISAAPSLRYYGSRPAITGSLSAACSPKPC